MKVQIKMLDWQKRGLTYTATGYGSKIPTQYMVHHENRWYRVYCMIYSNIGTTYVIVKGERKTSTYTATIARKAVTRLNSRHRGIS